MVDEAALSVLVGAQGTASSHLRGPRRRALSWKHTLCNIQRPVCLQWPTSEDLSVISGPPPLPSSHAFLLNGSTPFLIAPLAGDPEFQHRNLQRILKP